jgi:hypothetical protein
MERTRHVSTDAVLAVLELRTENKKHIQRKWNNHQDGKRLEKTDIAHLTLEQQIAVTKDQTGNNNGT